MFLWDKIQLQNWYNRSNCMTHPVINGGDISKLH